MTISTISGVGGLQQAQSVTNATNQLQAVLNSILGGTSDATNISEASQLQSQTAGLKQVSTSLAQASSLVQVAGGGVEQIQGALTQLQSLAQQGSSPVLNATDRAALNQQFTQTIKTIDQIASGTTFNGQNLLNGALSGNGALSVDTILGAGSSGNATLSIPNLGSSSLLAGIGNLSTPTSAGQALGVINNTLVQTNTTNSAIGSFQQTLGFASASVDTAVINQQAASASLSDTDIAAASTLNSQDQVQQAAAIALAAQGNNLSPALLKLIS